MGEFSAEYFGFLYKIQQAYTRLIETGKVVRWLNSCKKKIDRIKDKDFVVNEQFIMNNCSLEDYARNGYFLQLVEVWEVRISPC